MMRAIQVVNGSMQVSQVAIPEIKADEVLIRVHATALNRADTLQRRGLYSPPPGTTNIMGLECAGEVERVGESVTKFKQGDRVMALLSGGGYAEYAAAHQDHIMPIPENYTYVQAAAIPETYLTAYQCMFTIANANAGDSILVHAGASGVGTSAISMCQLFNPNIKICASVSNQNKIDLCKSLGAHAVNYKQQNLKSEVLNWCRSNGRTGVDVVLDCVGGSAVDTNIEVLDMDGRWVVYGVMGGAISQNFPLATMLRKRINMHATTLRNRSTEYKAKLVADFSRDVLPAFSNQHPTGRAIAPIVDKVYKLDEMNDAHRYMESNESIGKIIVEL